MKNAPLYRRILSVALVVAMLASFLVPVAGAEPAKAAESKVELELTPIDPGTLETQKTNLVSEDTSINKEEHAMTDVVRVSIALDKPATLDKFSADGVAENAAAMAYRDELRADQAAVTARIEKAIGGKLDVMWNLTLAANFISANVLYGQIDAIKAVDGVSAVFLENRYEPQVDEQVDEPENGSASYMIGSNIAWANGYTGAGSKVAVIDTGADIEHQSFSAEGLEYAFAQTAAEKGMSYDDYVASLNLLTAEAIEAVKGQLNANIGSGAAAYRNTKVGYGYNYVDKDVSYIVHMNDSQGEHGSHVSGIATANRFVKVGDEFKPALQAVGTQGVAPDAQLVVMKVFGKGGGAYDSDYMVAIEDAIVLGCDSANLSLGSGSPGFGFSGSYESVMNKLVENGLVVSFSAGNSGMWYDTPYNSAMQYPYLYIDDANYATGGSPGSFTNTLAVASVDNGGQTGMPLLFGDMHVFYSETSGYGNSSIATIAGNEYEYVLLDNVGVDDNEHVGQEGDYFAALGSDVISGKVAMCYRGSSSFFAKANAAVAQGAVAVIIINNQAGVINMNLTGYNYSAPAVSILKADGDAIKANSEAVTDEEGNVLYYKGSMSIASEMEIQIPEITDTVNVSSFSAYGVPGTLVLKPEILAPGGSIYSVWGANIGASSPTNSHEDYEVMSGTSMAAPQVAGMAAVMGQYIRDNGLCEKTGLTQRQLINSLLMSTAHPVYDSYGDYWAVIRVGSGLANVADATAAKSYILMDEDATLFPDSARDGKVKAELGDDPERTGVYTYSFTVNPLEGAKEFTLRTDVFTQGVAGNGGYGILADTGTMLLGAQTTYEVNGEIYEDTYLLEADVNMDGETDAADAQAILDYLTGKLGEEDPFDAEVADIDGDGKISSLDAKYLLDNASTPTIVAEEPVKVTVTITLDEDWKEILDYPLYYNGHAYIEGYTYVDPVADEEGNMDVVHSIPFLGYYGSWTDAPMLDRSSVIDAAYGTGKLPYLNNTNTNYMSVKDADGNTAIYMGNPYLVEDEFPAERLALNSETTIAAFNYLNIRNAATLGYAVMSEEGEVLYSQATATNKYSAYYYVNGGAWQNYSPTNFNVGKKLSAAGVKEGDKITVGFYALPEYYGILNAKLNGEIATSGGLDNAGFAAVLNEGVVGEGAGIKYAVTIDDTAPVVTGALRDLITGDITVKCSDENYVAYVAVLNASGSKEYFGTCPEQSGPNEALEVPLSLEGQTLPNEVVLLVADYAGNEAAFKVSLGGEPVDYSGTFIGFVSERSTAAPGSGNRVWEIDKDELSYNYSAGEYTGLSVFAQTDFSVLAAEYVDGYVFMAASDGWIYAAEFTALDEAARVGKYSDTVSVIYDMAYNNYDDQLYLLGNDNVLYTMDLISGELTAVLGLELTGVSNGSANRLAIDDRGNFYTANYGSTSEAKLFKFRLPEPEAEEQEDESLVAFYDFETDPAEDGWSFIDSDGDGKNWIWGTNYNAYSGGSMIYSQSYAGGALTPDNWAISPAFSLAEAETADFSFMVRSQLGSYPETYAVYAGTSANIEEMVKLGDDLVSPGSWTKLTFDLADYAGEEEVYIAIRHYNCVDMYWLDIEDVEIHGYKAEEPEEPGELEVLSVKAVGTMGVWNYSDGGAFAWDHANKTLYLASNYNATQDYDHYLWIVDTKTGAAAKANSVNGSYAARLYGCVNGLFIVPGGGSMIEPTDEALDVIVEPEELNLLRGQTASVKAYAMPWTLTDNSVTWTIADASIATVDNGVVTGVSVGETVLTVTTVAEPNISKEIPVIVTDAPNATMRGIIWDENGKGQASVFESNLTNEWTALETVGQLRWGALVDDMVYGSTDDTMYAFDADTYEVTQLGAIVSMWIPSDAVGVPADLPEAWGITGRVAGICNNGTYFEVLDPEAGSLNYWNLSSSFSEDPMALIAYVGRLDYVDVDGDAHPNSAQYYMMTESGKLWYFYLDQEGYLIREEAGETGLDLTGVSDVTNQIWASMVYDEASNFLYVSHYDGDADYAYLYAIDAENPAANAVVGDFNENVWPVVGLYQYEPSTDLSLKVSPTDLELYVDQTAELKIKVKLGTTNAWTAEVADPEICSIDENGVVTGLKKGETTIKITTVDTNEAGEHLSATVNVTVKELVSLNMVVSGQVTDANGARFTDILLTGPVAAEDGFAAPFDVDSGALGGTIYFASNGSSLVPLDPTTFQQTTYSGTISSYYSYYPALDLANYPTFYDSEGTFDDHKVIFTTEAGYFVTPDFYGWNLGSIMPDMAGLAFAGNDTDDEGTEIFIYYLMTTAGVLYELDVDYANGSLAYAEIMETGITVTDPSALSMAFGVGYDLEDNLAYGLVIANNEDQNLWFIDFQTGDVGMVGALDSTNVSGLIGYFDDLDTVAEEPPEPFDPGPEPSDPGEYPAVNEDLAEPKLTWDFETDPAEDGWTFFNRDNDKYSWVWTPGSSDYSGLVAYEGAGMIVSNSYVNNVGAVTPDEFAISPAIDLSECEDANFAIWAKGQDPSWASEVFAFYAGTSPIPGEMVKISADFTTDGDWTQYKASLKDFAGEDEVYVAIRHYNCTDMYILDVDYAQILVAGDAPAEPDYYLVGSMNEWTEDEAYKLAADEEAEGKFVLKDVELAAAAELKIKSSEGAWYPDNADNYVVAEAGTYDVEFYPAGEQGEGFYYGFFKLTKQEEPAPEVDKTALAAKIAEAEALVEDDYTEESWLAFAAALAEAKAVNENEEATQAEVDEALAALVAAIEALEEKPAPQPGPDYYLVGSMNEWTEAEAYKLSADAEAEGKFVLNGVELAAAAELKIKSSEGAWYPDNADNYVVSEAGTYDVEFYPAGEQGEGFYYGFFKLTKQEEEPAPEPGNARKIVAEFKAPAARFSRVGDGIASMSKTAMSSFDGAVLEAAQLGETTKANGGLNAIKGEAVYGALRAISGEPGAADGNVTIALTEDEAVTNGLFTVEYDPEVLTFVSALSEIELHSVNEAEGIITFAYAALEEIEAGNALLTLNFTYDAREIDTVVTVKTAERNDDLEVDETVEIPVKAEPAMDLIFKLGTELHDGDQVVIYNPAYGKALSNEAVSTNYRAGKDVVPENDEIVNPDADLIWNVAAVEGGFELTDAEGHKLSIQAGKNNLPLDADDTVWEIQAAKDEGNVYVVSATSVGSSGDHRAIEWYDRYNEFSAYYLTASSDETLFAQQLYVLGEDSQPASEDGFYLIGVNGWNVGSLTKGDKFELNPNAENEYMLKTSLAAGDEIKVVKVENKTITAWYPSDAGNYVVDEAHAGDVTVYFSETYKSDWAEFGGFFYIEAHTHAYGEPEWAWNEDLTAATATFTCECGDTVVLDAEITEEITVEPTDHAEGEKTITAKVVFNGTEYTDVKTVVLEKLEHDCPCADFTDMPEFGTTEHDAIDWAYTHDPQITNGMSATTFGPELTVTRGQAVTFLWRAAGCPEPTNTEHSFTDVKTTAFYYTAMLWAVEKGITTGTTTTTFSPNKTCTIEQILTFIYRYMGEPEIVNTENPWSDVNGSGFSFKAIMWAVENGIAAPKSETEFGRKDDCTRVAIVTYLYRIMTGEGLLN